MGASVWEQSLLAKNDNATLLLIRVACVASKLCSHRSSHSLKSANHASFKTGHHHETLREICRRHR
ncbi:hypothetical protein CVG87_04605 [Pseudomonas sp. WCS365]|nr:hypothetical protein CVG87_04605 [Pseudomonas sp. WCS365]